MIPTRSQVEAYTTDHLVDAAEHWGRLADRWEDAHWQVRNQAHSLDWEGFGGDALRARTVADCDVATGKAAQLREAATIARRGAGDISAAQRRVMYAVQDAKNAGFKVGENLSVTDTRRSRNAGEQAARQAQAQAFAADIRSRATELVGLDHEVGANITAAAGGVGATTFTENPARTPELNGNKIQMAGFGPKQDPPPQPPAPGGAIKLPPRTEPAPVQVITAEPPDAANIPERRTGVGFPNCPPEVVVGKGLEVLGGAAGAALGVAGEAPTLGGATLGIMAGAAGVWDGIEGLEQCK